MPHRLQAGEFLARRYRLDDLLAETENGRFWRGWDRVLSRPVAVHLMAGDHPHAARMLEAARSSARLLHDRRVLRVLDAAEYEDHAFVVNEWGQGTSLDLLLQDGPLEPRRAAHLVSEVADCLAGAHEVGLAHGRLAPEQVLLDRAGQVRLIGFAVDAAIHGLPAGRTSVDVTDTVGLLYAALTARWAGTSTSSVTEAPHENGVLLRPRQVRAGIPRPLDQLCDAVLNPYAAHHRAHHDRSSAQGIAEELAEFVGDPTGLLPVPETPGAADYAGAPGAAQDPAEEPPQQFTTDTSTGHDSPATESGLPVFHDDTDTVSWFSTSTPESPPPPPPFEPPPDRPLFAPEPSDGGPVRRPRHARWAHQAEPPTMRSGVPLVTPAPGTDATHDTADDQEPVVPGRSWLRLAMLVALCVLVLVAAVAAYQVGGGLGLPDDDPTTSQAQQADRPQVYEQVTAEDFDPQGDPPEENSEDAPLVVDRDRATSWNTSTYNDQLGPPPGLKTGVGLLLDLGRVRDVSRVTVQVDGGTHELSAYVSHDRPADVTVMEPIAGAQGSGRLVLRADNPTPGRYVTVWLTKLSAVDGGFRGTVSEVKVAG